MLKKVSSLRFKIMLPVVILSTVILLIGIVFDFHSGKQFIYEELTSRAKLLASSTQFVIENAHDSIEIQRFVTLFRGEAGVKEVVVVAGNPLTVVSASKNQWIGNDIRILPHEYQDLIRQRFLDHHSKELQDSKNERIVYVLPLKISPRVTELSALTDGQVLIEISTGEDLAVILGLLYRHLWILISCLFATLFMIYWVMKKQVLKPIEMIQESMRKRVEGDTHSYVEYQAQDELGQLSRHTNDLYQANELQKKIIADQKDTVASAKVLALAEISGSIAHEINNPLFIINGALYRMEKQLQKEGLECQVMKDGIVHIQDMTDYIAKIIKGLKNLANADRSTAFAPVKMVDLVTETLRLYGTHLRTLGVEIRQDYISEQVQVLGQEIQLQQVLLNLLSNAADAVTPLEERWIAIGLNDLTDHWELSVTDSGSGIGADLHTKILNPFFTTKKAGKGTGLGLSIAVEIVRHHQGDLFLNTKHPNTQFVLRFKKYSGKETTTQPLDGLLGFKHSDNGSD